MLSLSFGAGLTLGLVLAGQPVALSAATGAVGGVLTALLISVLMLGALFGSGAPRGTLPLMSVGGFCLCAGAAYFSVAGAGG